jgi:periplasmic protein TonB
MSTFDHPTDLVHRLAYTQPRRSALRIDFRVPESRGEEKDQLSVRFQRRGNDTGHLFYFIEPRPRNPWAGLASLAFLAIVVSGMILIPLYHIDPLPKRETLTSLYLLPPPAAGGPATKFHAPKLASTPVPTSTGITAPVHKAQEAPPAASATDGGVIGGVPGGMVGGIPGGMLNQIVSSRPGVPVAAKPPEPMPVKRIRVASRVVEANLVHDVPPQYPTEAGRERIEGTVVLMAVIGADGTVKDVRVESGLPILAQAAIDAVRQWRYKPYLIDGQPVEVDSRITINFTLSAS